MQHAILITAYKNRKQLEGLIDTFSPNFRCYIHIDKKSSLSDNDLEILSKKPNVDFVCRHYKINWGGVNHLLAIIMLLQEAIKNPANQYFHLITGQDFPIKPVMDIDRFFEENNGREFMEVFKMPYEKWWYGGYDRIDQYVFADAFNRKSTFGKAVIRTSVLIQRKLGFKRKYYEGFPELYGGSTYWSVSRDCAHYITQYIDNNPRYLKRFKYTFCTEEIFFQTIVMNSPFGKNVTNNPLRYIVWEVRNGNFPANLDEQDEEAIRQSDAIFARKFESPVSDGLLSNIKKRIKQ
ncbi:hypothetical protein M2132_001726 [Dysgonomonas sp. PH5-45]|uniref:beta-1,6-N-acetylglucosaminyltransferase n=1 Tax=unclassified Dysgonomonas TaxID=2630389 RepID=UPI0024755A23|nr:MULTISPECIES: beta-1,6-N-acetylglucosaminyltransferase [unclassified Dysgonomonas]MDH6355385.1 hypothetical protein [Dysgonomonas sp. PH5-45]MDH6388283.1 hypothetical protein [Dysgonomonas sp. PH5-37]